MVKKAQGALEFLMTYGWAFLVILIMIGALAYFGILNPTRFLPDRCDFGTQVLCGKDQYIINNEVTTTLQAKITNNAGGNIALGNFAVVSDIDLGACDICFNNDSTTDTCVFACGGAECDFNAALPPNVSVFVWPAGVAHDLVLDCPNGDQLGEGDKIKVGFNYKWFSTSAGSTYTKDGSGEVYAAVQ